MSEFLMLISEPCALVADWDEAAAPEPCPVCGRRTADDPGAGYRARLDAGRELLDLMYSVPLYAVSDAFVTWYENDGRRGLDFQPLPEAGFSRAIPVSVARLDASSNVEVADQCERCGFKDVHVGGPWRIDESTWDGSDFFRVEERPTVAFCTADAMSAVQASALTGPVFIELRLVAI